MLSKICFDPYVDIKIFLHSYHLQGCQKYIYIHIILNTREAGPSGIFHLHYYRKYFHIILNIYFCLYNCQKYIYIILNIFLYL